MDKTRLYLEKTDVNASSPSQVRELRLELAGKIASFMGSQENRATDIPGVTLHRRIAPTAPCTMTYQPGITVIAQGRKRVDLDPTTFIYGESQYLLTSVDLPNRQSDLRGQLRSTLSCDVAETRNACRS